MARGKVKAYKEQSFDHLHGLAGISDNQIAEHLKLYGGYVKQVNALNEDLAGMLGQGKASGKDPEFVHCFLDDIESRVQDLLRSRGV